MSDRSWSSRYELAFGIGLALLFVYGPARTAVAGVLVEAGHHGYAPVGVLAALCCLVVAVWTAGWYFAGPLAISAERLQWNVWRRDPHRWLVSDRRRVLAIGAVLAAILASLTALALGGVLGPPAILFGLAFWMALQSLLLVVLRLQHLDLDAVARAVPATFGVTGVGLSTIQVFGVLAALVTLLVLVLLLLAGHAGRVRTAPSELRRSPDGYELTPRWQLRRGARNRWSAHAGVATMDLDIVRVVGERDGNASAVPLPGLVHGGGRAVGLFLVTLVRRIRPAAIAVAFTLPVVLAVHGFLGPLPAVTMLALLELFLTVTMSRGLRAWLGRPALRRVLAVEGNRFPIALAVPGLLACALVVSGTAPALGLPASVTLLLLVLPAGVMVRQQHANRTSEQLTLLATPAGPLPLQVMDRAIAGPDVVLATLLLAGALL